MADTTAPIVAVSTPSLQTVLLIIQAVTAVGAALPEIERLISDIKAAFSSSDRATIEAAMNDALAAADTQHKEAQNL